MVLSTASMLDHDIRGFLPEVLDSQLEVIAHPQRGRGAILNVFSSDGEHVWLWVQRVPKSDVWLVLAGCGECGGWHHLGTLDSYEALCLNMAAYVVAANSQHEG